MNKKGIADGFTWFFAIIAVTLVLILFYLSISLLTSSVNENRGDIYLGDFYKQDSLRQIIFMEDYSHDVIYNNLSYGVFDVNYDFSPTYSLPIFLGMISMEIFSKTNSGISPAYLTFSFGTRHIDWSINGMVLSDNLYLSGPEGIDSKLSSVGSKLSYQDVWDSAPGKISFTRSSYGRVYRIYFANKGVDFAKFGISAAVRSYAK